MTVKSSPEAPYRLPKQLAGLEPSRQGQARRRQAEEHSRVPQPSREARPGDLLPPRTRTRALTLPQRTAPQTPRRRCPKDAARARRSPSPTAPAPRQLRSAAPHRLWGGGTNAAPQTTTRLRAVCTLLLLLQTCRHRTASRRHRLNTAPALSKLGFVVLSHHLPAQPQGGTSALGLQLPRASAAK